MPRKLVTEFVKIATAGETIDGRNISEQQIHDMAETYDRNDYTAVISYEHIKYFGNMGVVQEVKTDKDGKGRVSLYAKITPSEDLIYINRNGQKLFTSIELNPDFVGTGKAYLVGLAVTDTPASLGTEELHFSNRKQAPNNVFSNTVELQPLQFEQEGSLLNRLFGRTQQTDNPSDDEMSKEALENLTQTVANLASKVEAFTAAPIAPVVTTPVKPEEVPTDLVEKFNTLSAANTDLSEKFNTLQAENAELKTEFAVLKESLGEPVPGTNGGQDLGDESTEADII